MQIFVTGATGFIGSAVVQELLDAGHRVLGLARSDESANALRAAGAEPHRGDLGDLDSLRRGAEVSDGVIHTAFIHDFAKFKENCEIDRRAIGALADVLAGSDRRLVVTSGTALVAGNGIATEPDMPPPADDAHPRVASEEAADAAAERGVDVSVVRLPPSVHGAGDHGFVPLLIGLAREKGAAAYVDGGDNVWPAVHRLDAARLYRIVLERGAEGARYHGVAEEGVPFREIAGAIGRGLNVPVEAKAGVDANAYFGWFGGFAGLNNPTSSAWTRRTLGWEPHETGLIADIESAGYFGR